PPVGGQFEPAGRVVGEGLLPHGKKLSAEFVGGVRSWAPPWEWKDDAGRRGMIAMRNAPPGTSRLPHLLVVHCPSWSLSTRSVTVQLARIAQLLVHGHNHLPADCVFLHMV